MHTTGHMDVSGMFTVSLTLGPSPLYCISVFNFDLKYIKISELFGDAFKGFKGLEWQVIYFFNVSTFLVTHVGWSTTTNLRAFCPI